MNRLLLSICIIGLLGLAYLAYQQNNQIMTLSKKVSNIEEKQTKLEKTQIMTTPRNVWLIDVTRELFGIPFYAASGKIERNKETYMNDHAAESYQSIVSELKLVKKIEETETFSFLNIKDPPKPLEIVESDTGSHSTYEISGRFGLQSGSKVQGMLDLVLKITLGDYNFDPTVHPEAKWKIMDIELLSYTEPAQ